MSLLSLFTFRTSLNKKSTCFRSSAIPCSTVIPSVFFLLWVMIFFIFFFFLFLIYCVFMCHPLVLFQDVDNDVFHSFFSPPFLFSSLFDFHVHIPHFVSDHSYFLFHCPFHYSSPLLIYLSFVPNFLSYADAI